MINSVVKFVHKDFFNLISQELPVIEQDDIFPGILLHAVEYQRSKYYIHPPQRVIK